MAFTSSGWQMRIDPYEEEKTVFSPVLVLINLQSHICVPFAYKVHVKDLQRRQYSDDYNGRQVFYI